MALVGGRHRRCAWRNPSVRNFLVVRRDHSAADWLPHCISAELLLALLYGLLTALVFALWPLGRAHDVPVAELFRDMVELQPRWPRKRYIAFTALAVLVLAAFAVLLAYDRRVALIYVATAAAVFLLLRVIAALMMILASRAPRARATGLRMAVANIHRPSALTPTIVLSLGLGITLLVTVIEIDGNLSRQFANELPARAPSFYFLDIPADQSERFGAFLRTAGPIGKIGGSANAARAHRFRRRHPGGEYQAERGCRLGAAKRPRDLPMRTRSPAARDWSKENGGGRLRRAAARFVREAHRRRPRPETGRPGRRQCPWTQHHRDDRQHAHGRLGEPWHQFRDGVFAECVSRRAAHPSRDPDLSRWRHAGGRGSRHPLGRSEASLWSRRCA